MSSLAEKLHKWCIQELNLVSEGGIGQIPNVESLSKLTKGKNKRIWNYVVNHVRSQSYVDHVKRTLSLRKQLKDKEEAASAAFWKKDSLDAVKLRDSISKAKERHQYLTQSLSAIEENILTLEQKVKNIKNERFKINQKTALLQHLKYLYDEKNVNLESLLIYLSTYKDTLNSYPSSKACDEGVVAVPRNFLFDDDAMYEHKSRVRDLAILHSTIMKNRFNRDNDAADSLTEDFHSGVAALSNCDLLLTDFLIILKEMSESDLQQLISLNLQSSTPVKEFLQNKKERNPVNVLLMNIKQEAVLNSLNAMKNKRLSAEKANIIANKIREVEQSVSGSEHALQVFRKLAENNSLIASNSYLEEFLGEMTSKTDAGVKNFHRRKQLSKEEFGSVLQKFYGEVHLTFHLRYNAPLVMQTTMDEWNKLTYYIQDELFEEPLPSKECTRKLKADFSSGRKQAWEYCDSTDLLKPPLSGPLTDHGLTLDACRSLSFQPFENLSALCENWLRLKRKLLADAADCAKTFARSDAVCVSETRAKIYAMLEQMKFSTEKGTQFVGEGSTCCHKAKFLVCEWWDQNAQYIPDIVHEGKTLKMWIAILEVLTNFELKRYA